MEVIVSGRRKWKSDTRKEKRKPTQLGFAFSNTTVFSFRFLSGSFRSPPSFIFLRLSLLFTVELYNSERVSIARGSALRGPVLSVQYLHGSRAFTKERNLSIPVFSQGRFPELHGWNHYRATLTGTEAFMYRYQKERHSGCCRFSKANRDGPLCIDQKWSAVNHGHRTLSPAHDWEDLSALPVYSA